MSRDKYTRYTLKLLKGFNQVGIGLKLKTKSLCVFGFWLVDREVSLSIFLENYIINLAL